MRHDTEIEFTPWPKTPRWESDWIVTEKIDGTNSAVKIIPLKDLSYIRPSSGVTCAEDIILMDHVGNDKAVAIARNENEWYVVLAQSRNRFITPEDDNYGFAAWVRDNAMELVRLLGVGTHFGEWWGHGIQRGYGLVKGDRRFSLFNVVRYGYIHAEDLSKIPALGVVPTIDTFSEAFHAENGVDFAIDECIRYIEREGSTAAPGWDKPEGIIAFHKRSGQTFKHFTKWAK